MADEVVIARRFRGPPASANGGDACGVLGARLGGPAEMTLRAPPPLDEPLALLAAPGRLELRRGDTLVAAAVPAAREPAVPEPLSAREAEEASRGYPWFSGHPYPCRLRARPRARRGGRAAHLPRRVRGRELAAAPWRPGASLAGDDGRVRAEIVWAALDCPSWFGVAALREWQGMVLLGRLAARIVERPRHGDSCVAIGWPLAVDGRKLRSGSALFADDGRLLGAAEATWIALR